MTILCTIDLETREVSLPAGQVIASYDHNVDVIRFQAETIPGFSLDTSSIKIAAQGPNNVRHDYSVDPATVAIEEETGYITFDWPIPSGVTEMPIGSGFKYGDKGQLIFAVCAEIISGDTVSKAWHSDDGIITVVAHLEPESGGGEDPSETATNAQKIGQLQTDVAVIRTEVGALGNGTPPTASSTSEMDPDESTVYINTTDGNWYYYDGTAWTSGGTYGGAVTDTTLSVSGAAADAKAVGDALAEKADADDVTALDTRVTAVEGTIEDVRSDLLSAENGDVTIPLTWERGTIVNGDDSESYTTIRTVGYIDLSTDPVKRVLTTESVRVGWHFYDASKNYIANSYSSATVDGVRVITLNATASYARFDAVTLDASVVKIVKDSLSVLVRAESERYGEAHNQLANEMCEFACPISRGILDVSTGAEAVNNNYVRTDYINIADYKIVGFYAPVSAGISVIEYASDKSFIRRSFYDTTGVNKFSYHADTVYIRVAYLANRTVKILQAMPFLTVADKTNIVDSLRTGIADIKSLSEKCVHHDNFSRTETGYAIGKNSEGTLTDNSYDTVTGASADDGVRVDNGLTIAADNTRSDVFTVRKIAAAHEPNFMVEFNAPASGQGIYIIYKLTDATNFTAINIGYSGTYYGCIQRTIVNGSFGDTIDKKNIYDSLGYVVRLYFLGGVIAVFVDDKYCYSFYADAVDEYVYIGSYKGVTAHFDFINVFDLIPPLVHNTAYLTDNDVSTLPDSTISANTDRYALDGTTTRFSNKSEHFMLYATDEKIYNGRRTERSLVALLPGNLRTMRYEFDVLFPASILPDTATESYADIFFQLHDRQTGVSRGHVPFDLSLTGNEIHLSQYYASEQASGTLTPVVSGLNLGKVTYDKWMHFDILVHERYEERQQPFTEIKVNGDVVYQSRKPNCANDVKGTSAQYGEYKNNFDLITYSERYIDNFKVTY